MRTQAPPNPYPGQAGFALVEVIVSAVLVVIMASGTLFAIQATQRTSAEERHRATAHGIAQEDQARMRAFRISSLANYNETRQVMSDDGRYTVQSRADFVTDSTGTASCEQNTAAADYIRISSTITWPSIGSRPPVVIQSIVAPPNGAIAANRGALAIAVKGGADQAIPNISLSGSGAGSFSGSTSENGCVIFGNLPAGNYTLTTNAPGYVDKDGQPPGAVNTSVVALSTNTLALQYDEPGGAEVSFTTLKDGQLVQSSAESVVVFNTGMTAAQIFTATAPVESLTAEPLFPFSSPDTVYAGGCQANNPNPDNEMGSPGEAAQASVQVVPDQVAPAEIQLPSLRLQVLSGTGPGNPGSPVADASVVLTDLACAGGGPDGHDRADHRLERRPGGSGVAVEHLRHLRRQVGKRVDDAERQRDGPDLRDSGDCVPRRGRGGELRVIRAVRQEDGYSLTELIVAASAGALVLLALFAMFDIATKNSAQVTQRADANARAKPAIQQLMNDLHSSCTGPAIAPVLAGSNSTELHFQAATGVSVSPTPEKHVVKLANGTLTESVYPATGGANPNWTYSATPSSTRILIEKVSAPETADGPVFSYYASEAGVLQTAALPVPLSAADAARAVQVQVGIQVAPSSAPVDDPNSSVTLTDAAVFRFSPFSEDPTKVNGPCA